MKKQFLFALFNIVLFYIVISAGYYSVVNRFIKPLQKEVTTLKQDNDRLTTCNAQLVTSNNRLVRKAIKDDMIEKLAMRAEQIEYQDISQADISQEKK